MTGADVIWLVSKAVIFGGVLASAAYVWKTGLVAQWWRSLDDAGPPAKAGPVPPHMRGDLQNIAPRTGTHLHRATSDDDEHDEVTPVTIGDMGLRANGTLTALHFDQPDDAVRSHMGVFDDRF